MLFVMTLTFLGEYHSTPDIWCLVMYVYVLEVAAQFLTCFDLFRNIKFNYCILDEGHVIKNGKTKLSKAIKQLAANFRVILSGTPIQVR